MVTLYLAQQTKLFWETWRAPCHLALNIVTTWKHEYFVKMFLYNYYVIRMSK